MSLIKTTPEELQTLSSQVTSGSESIQGQLSQLQNQVSGVIGGEWMGAASGAFNMRYEEWNRSALGLKDALDGISQLLAHAAVQYQTTEDGIRSTFG
ncbi:MAG TPA: WXG100 family type VII secretion target [Solirubrobacteraceae bacterium]|jgi:WXG100 family type VII secretion target|nr:WXG100 family type VII secretion target [Solirubrobacteraceae bacterium]